MRHKLYGIWSQVPVNYYQQGVKSNLLQKYWHTKKISLAIKLIKEMSFKNCLDVGCASGFMLSEIQKSFPKAEYFGVDVYDKAINYAKKFYPGIKFFISSGEKLPFKDNSFDLVISYETLEHVKDPLATLKEISRVLSKEGLFLLAMDSGSLLFQLVWSVWENTTGRVWQGAHLNPFHHHELDQVINKAGFKVKKKIFSHFNMEVVYVLKYPR